MEENSIVDEKCRIGSQLVPKENIDMPLLWGIRYAFMG